MPPAGRLYIVAGQSNATGLGLTSELPTSPVDLTAPQVTTWRYWYGPVSASNAVLEPLQPVGQEGDGLHHGVEISMAQKLTALGGRTNDVLVNTSWGGSGIDNFGVAATAYTELVSSVNASLTAAGISTAHTMVWWQGETDADDLTMANAYEAELTSLISRLRVDVASPALEVLVVRLHADSPATYATTVRAAQDAVAAADALVSLLDFDDLALNPDDVHYPSASLLTAGDRIADILLGIAAPTVELALEAGGLPAGTVIAIEGLGPDLAEQVVTAA